MNWQASNASQPIIKKQNMIVEFDETQITSLEIKDAVTEIGYTIA